MNSIIVLISQSFEFEYIFLIWFFKVLIIYYEVGMFFPQLFLILELRVSLVI